MLYHAYEMQRAFMQGASVLAAVTAEMLSNPRNPVGYFGLGPVAASALDVFAHAAATRGKPSFGIDNVNVEGKTYRVTESLVLHKPFGSLVRFTREGLGKDAPRLMIVAPMSGHYATLLRGTVERMVESCEVYITDWADAKLVPLSEGRFDLDDYIDYVIEFFEHIGPGAHAMAVCQPSVPTLAATAVMGATKNPCRPATLTLMGGPIDTRASPTAVNTIADQRPMSWFRHNVIATVPLQYPGAGREVYPGFLQLTSFMAMNLGNHIMSHYEMFKHLVVGDDESAEATKEFYDEYRAVCDMTAEFYLQTVEHVFQKQSLAKGELMHRGNLIDIGKITDTAILAVEGERDDISGIGQTRAAL
ncbi:MAG: polyhydroxyalkanoate depolymerase, partial [Novosphingobium sp.]|nr:polyhydroxyalkanoate depolymerase [Novosphingobium sp.]